MRRARNAFAARRERQSRCKCVSEMVTRRADFLLLLALLSLLDFGTRLSFAREAIADRETIGPAVPGSGYAPTAASESCQLDISTDVAKSRSPLLLHPDSLQLVHTTPSARPGSIALAADAAILLACPGPKNSVTGATATDDTPPQQQVTARCAGGTRFRLDKQTVVDMRRLQCARWPESQTLANGTCLWGRAVRLVTGFAVRDAFVPAYESCFDAAAERTVYTHYTLASDAAHAQRGVPRAQWRGREQFVRAGDPARLYQRVRQRERIAALLNSTQLAERYVSLTSDAFLSKGHLAAKTDFVQGAVQTATLRYTNAAPQWQTFNGNNWNALENDVRAFVQRLGRSVECYTGTVGQATLPDAAGVQRELSLGAGGTVPVPRAYWKVLYDGRTQRAVAFVGLNNPHGTLAEAQREVRCRDVCGRLTTEGGWRLTWAAHDVRRGYSFCCEVNDFRENYPGVLPGFAVVGLLS